MAKEVNKRVNIWLNQQGIEDNLKSIRAEIKKTENELAKIPIHTKEWYEKAEKLKQLKDIYRGVNNELSQTNNVLEKTTKGFDTITNGLKKFISWSQEYVEAFATLDDALSAVQKTTGMSREEVETLNNSLRNIDTRTANTELLKIAEIGGRMGIANDQIAGFTEAVNKANVALGDSFSGGAEEISAVLGKIALAYKETRAEDVGTALTQIGSALNEVGANANATEGNIAAFVQRIGAMPEAFRPSVQEAIALGAAFEESSIDAEVASRAFGIVLQKASTNIDAFARVMHQPVETIRELINTNPTQFFVEFAASLKGLQGTEVGNVLKDLKLNADGVNKIVGAMTANTSRFNEILNISNTAFSEATSLTNEYATVNNNAAAQLEKAKNKLQDARAELGRKLIPILTTIYEKLGELADGAMNLERWIKENKILVEALIPVLTTLGGFLAAGTIHKNITANIKAIKALNIEIKALGGYLKLLGTGGIIAGVTIAVVKGADKLQDWSDNARKAAMHTAELGNAYKTAAQQINEGYMLEQQQVADLIEKINDVNASYSSKVHYMNELNEIMPGYYDLLKDEKEIYIDTAQALSDLMKLQDAKRQKDFLLSTLDEYSETYKQFMKEHGAEVKKYNKEMQEASRKAVTGKWYEKAWYSLKSAYHTSNETFKNEAAREAKNMENIIASLMSQIDSAEAEVQRIQKEIAGRGNGGTRPAGDEQPTPPTGNNDKDKIKKFYEELEAFRKKQQTASLDGWAQIKQNILNSYEDIINKAKSLKLNKIADELTDERDAAIEKAGVEYLRKSADMILSFKEQAESILHPNNEDSPLLKAIAGTEKEWDNKLKTLQVNIAQMHSLLANLPEDDEQRKAFADVLDTMNEAYTQFSINKLSAISDTVKQYTKDTTDFITSETKRVRNATLSETEREKTAIIERYDTEVEKLQQVITLRLSRNADDPEVKNLQQQISDLEQLKIQAIALVEKNKQSIYEQLANFDFSTLKDNYKEGLKLLINVLQEFATAATDIFNSISKIQSYQAEKELQDYKETYDAKQKTLEKQLNSGVISQKKYDTELQKLNDEKDARERKLNREKFAREKTANIIQATITGIMAAMKSFTNGGGFPWGLIPMTLSAATTAAQIAAISAQPNPYAKGGFIRGAQIAMMGEAGDEWVASNKLLQNRQTAAIINALDDYQNGNVAALSRLQFSTPVITTPRFTTPQTTTTTNTNNNYYYTNDNNALLDEIKKMNNYLSDPNNRRAYISRKIQIEFQEQEEQLKAAARL